MYEKLVKMINSLSKKINEAQKKIDDYFSKRCAETQELAESNDECVLELGQTISDMDDCIMELASIVSELSESVNENTTTEDNTEEVTE